MKAHVPDEGYSRNAHVPDEGYSRNAQCTLNYISTILIFLSPQYTSQNMKLTK